MSWLSRALAIPGWMEPEELVWLKEQADRFERVLEVGTWKGRSAYALAQSGAQVWTVDHFQGSRAERRGAHQEAVGGDVGSLAEASLAGTGVKILRMDSTEAARLFRDGELDMVFIDGDHEWDGVLRDVQAWRPKCRYLLCGHDREMRGVQEGLSAAGVEWGAGPGSIWFTESIRPAN